MKVLLVDTNPAMCEAWRKHFAPQAAPDVTVIEGDICGVECDAIVSPANSFGFMDGGLDEKLLERFGDQLQETVLHEIRDSARGELLVGSVVVVRTLDHRMPWLIVAPTMRVPMDGSATTNAYLAMVGALSTIWRRPSRVAIPGLCTGVGKMPVARSAKQMWLAYQRSLPGNGWFPKGWRDAVADQEAMLR